VVVMLSLLLFVIGNTLRCGLTRRYGV
jgi:hypothetical protein